MATLINQRRKIIFIHPAKCGGNSVGQCLRKSIPGFFPIEYKMIDVPLAHVGINSPKIIKQLKYPLTDYFKLGIVRNPWDRLVSTWYFMKIKIDSSDKYSSKWNPIIKNMPFTEWVKRVCVSDEEYCDDKGKRLCMPNVRKTCSSMMSDSQGNLIMDYVIKLERLHFDLKEISNILGLALQYTHINKTATRKIAYQKLYNDTTIEIVRQYYQLDIDNFNYEFKKI